MPNVNGRAAIYRSLPVDVAEEGNDLLVSRGLAKLRFSGRASRAVLITVLAGTAGEGCTTEELRQLLPDSFHGLIDQCIGLLRSHNIVHEVTDVSLPDSGSHESNLDRYYWQLQGPDEEARRRVENIQVTVVGEAEIAQAIQLGLRSGGLENVSLVECNGLTSVATLPQHTGYCIAASTNGSKSLLRELNQRCLELQVIYLPVLLEDLSGYIGPWVGGADTSCYECYLSRRYSNLDSPEIHRRFDTLNRARAAYHPSMAYSLAHLAVLDAMAVFTCGLRGRTHSITEISFMTLQSARRRVLKVPRCAVCSATGLISAASLIELPEYTPR